MDMNKAVSSLERAIETLKSSGDSTAFVQVRRERLRLQSLERLERRR